SWYLFSLLALLLIGSQRFLYKVAAARDCSTFRTTFAFMATVALLAAAAFAWLRPEVPSWGFLAIISLLNSLTFASATLCHIQALKYVPASVAYPLIRMNIVLVVLFGVLFLQESLSWTQVLGLIFSLAAVWALSLDRNTDFRAGMQAKGLTLVGLALIAGGLSAISSKYAAVHTDIWAFIALSYILSTLLTLVLAPNMFSGAKAGKGSLDLGIGLAMGILNLAGFYMFLRALAMGPLSIVAVVNGMHFLVPVVLAAIWFKERLGLTRLLGLLMALAALYFLRG
ncbi:MAG: EamA family transporter, partial [Desulfohalobiaceae bacterium]